MSATIDASAVAVEIDESTKISDDSKWQFEAHAVSAVRGTSIRIPFVRVSSISHVCMLENIYAHTRAHVYGVLTTYVRLP